MYLLVKSHVQHGPGMEVGGGGNRVGGSLLSSHSGTQAEGVPILARVSVFASQERVGVVGLLLAFCKFLSERILRMARTSHTDTPSYKQSVRFSSLSVPQKVNGTRYQ